MVNWTRHATIAATLFLAPAISVAQTTGTPAAPTVASPPTATVTTPVPAASARRASNLIGSNVINEANRGVGEIHDLMVDTAGGATIAILSVGGFLGMGERYVAIPLSDLRWNQERERWMLAGATEEGLRARPAFTYPPSR
jgi:sporulation protein YlmC with PRC-barrel domain